jgi:hypothetical protein
MDARTFNFESSVIGRRDNRRQPRIHLFLDAQLRNRGAGKVRIRVVDMSTTGFRAEAHYGLNAGDVVWITLPGMQGLEAVVAWRENQIIGCRFVQPLHPAVLSHIVKSAARY